MYSGKSILAIIPARGGSKGIPKKNIRDLAGKPLIAWTIEECKKSKYIDRFILSSDNEEIINVARQWGCEVPFIRPPELAQDDTPGNDVIVHALHWFNVNEEKKYDFFVLLQPTSPLRKQTHIDSAIKLFAENKDANSLVSVSEVNEHPFWMKKIDENGYLQDFIDKKENVTRRQDLPKVLSLNGAIYISEISSFIEEPNFYSGNCLGFKMDKKSSLDIDTMLDFEFANSILSKSG